MRGPPVVLTNTLGRPVTNIISERGAVPMTVVNTLGEPVTLVAQGGEPVTLFNANGTLWDYPFSLFANNEQGAWYDPSDFTTLYSSSTGGEPFRTEARRNLLTYSEQFDNAAWGKVRATVSANGAAAPDGTMTADKLVEDATASNSHLIASASVSFTSGTTYTFTVYAKAGERSQLGINGPAGTGLDNPAVFNLSNGTVVSAGSFTASLQALANGWYRCIATATASGTGSGPVILRLALAGSTTYTGDGASGVYIWGAQLQTAADQTSTGGAYQRIAAATDYDTSNPVWRPYLAFDGVDDFFNLASAISITTDMTVLRGFGRSAAGIRSAGLGPASGTEPRDYFWQTTNIESYGLGATAQTLTADTATGYFVGTLRRSATDEFLRRNGTQISTRAAPAVSGSFTKLGDLSGNLNNGPIYGLIVLDRELTGSELTATEQWMAGKTGATLA